MGLTVLVACACLIIVAPLALVYAGWLPPVAGLLTAAGLVGAIAWWWRDRMPGILAVFAGALLLSTVVSSPAPKVFAEPGGATEAPPIDGFRSTGPFNEALPVIVHIVLDEMQSTGAIDASATVGAAARDRLLAMGERNGLRTFDSVYSRYFFSGVALPNLMNAELEGQTGAPSLSTTILESISDNAYFDRMAALGYRTAVFQTSVLDFCAHPGAAICETFDSFDPGGDDAGMLDTRSRTLTLWQTLLRTWEPSYVSEYGLRAVRRYYGLEEDRPLGIMGTEGRFDVQRFPVWFDRFVAFVSEVPRGSHIFAHFMVPHSPYLLTRDCLVSGTFEAGYYLGRSVPDPEAREAARRRLTDAYLAQVECVATKLDGLLDAIIARPDLADARIIIHGDHGSRISVGNVLEDYETRDLVANYATYFTVKAPGVSPGIDCAFLSLPEAFRRYIDPAGPLPPLDRARPPVVVDSRAAGGRKVEVPMPVFGCAATEAK